MVILVPQNMNTVKKQTQLITKIVDKITYNNYYGDKGNTRRNICILG